LEALRATNHGCVTANKANWGQNALFQRDGSDESRSVWRTANPRRRESNVATSTRYAAWVVSCEKKAWQYSCPTRLRKLVGKHERYREAISDVCPGVDRVTFGFDIRSP
jgi:hypothetical protein